jgi:hypothetical protein
MKSAKTAALRMLVVLLAFGSSACTFLSKKTEAATPPAPKVIQPPKPAPRPQVQLPGDGPVVQEKIDTVPQPPVVAETPMPQPPPKRKTEKPNKKNTQEAQVQPPPASVDPSATHGVSAPSVAPPRLGQMLTTQQAESYIKTLDESLDRTKQALGVVETKSLTNEQTEVVGRIRSFLIQAEQTREKDLVTAVRLASRADLLSRDLLSQIR